jgi:hypothetical protein
LAIITAAIVFLVLLIVLILFLRRRAQGSEHEPPVLELRTNPEVFDDYELKELSFATYTGFSSFDEDLGELWETVHDEGDL